MKKLTVKLEYEDSRAEAVLTTLGTPSDERILSLYKHIREIVNAFNETTKKYQKQNEISFPSRKDLSWKELKKKFFELKESSLPLH